MCGEGGGGGGERQVTVGAELDEVVKAAELARGQG